MWAERGGGVQGAQHPGDYAHTLALPVTNHAVRLPRATASIGKEKALEMKLRVVQKDTPREQLSQLGLGLLSLQLTVDSPPHLSQ
jgi:hypothetical protein